ncbi:hypothetical protein [Nocardioides lentus]
MTDKPTEGTEATAEIVEVSPALAETWLSRNPNNRNLRRPVVDGYARDMEAGRWRLNGETLKFSADGQLYDGQHRLNAIVQAGATVPMVIVRGLTPDVMPTVDAGAKRTYSDALKLTGEENTATLAAVCRRAVMWERGMRTNTGAIRPTPLEMDDWLTRHPEIRNSADLANRLASRERLPASVIGLCHWLSANSTATQRRPSSCASQTATASPPPTPSPSSATASPGYDCPADASTRPRASHRPSAHGTPTATARPAPSYRCRGVGSRTKTSQCRGEDGRNAS